MSLQPTRAADCLKFGEGFELDVRAYELRSEGIPVKLKPIPMKLLLLLIERRGELVTRNEIVERVWGNGVFLDTDNSINGAVSKIRQALRDNPEQPRFVQTVTGKGYRFIATVAEIGRAAPEPPSAAPPESQVRVEDQILSPVAPPPASQFRPLLLVGSILLMLALGAYWQWFHLQARTHASGGRVMLAVLPFENLTGDGNQDYVADGMTEEMITRLGSLDPAHLGVIARTSVMRYKGPRQRLEQIGRELGVQYVLEGSIRRESNTVRVAAQLIQMKDQTHLWARQYDRADSNLLALQAEIAQEIAYEIEARIGGHQRFISVAEPASSGTAEAYELYLKGRYFWNKRTARSLQQAIEYFQQAVDKDPSYARAHAGIAESYALMGGYTGLPQIEFIAKARAAAQRALQLDEQLPEAHTALAVIAQNYDWDWQTAEKEYQRAIQLNPSYATGHHWYAECLALQGRFDEAFSEIESARQLDPFSLIIATDYGAILYFSRRYDRASERFRAVLEMEPNFPRAHMLVWTYAQQGLFADALADAEAWRRSSNLPWSWAMIAYVAGRSGDRARAESAVEQLRQLGKHGALDSLSFAVAYIGMGNNDAALTWLEKAYMEHSSGITALKVDPTYDPLRGDSRFQALLRRIGLAQ